jgi:pimeloyl-ACP methyl ester carboxylesterase
MPPEWHDRLAAGDAAAVVRELAAGTGEHLNAELLRRIDTPVRVLCGDESQTVLADAARRTAEAINDAVLVDVPASGHAVQLDASPLVADTVAALRTEVRR